MKTSSDSGTTRSSDIVSRLAILTSWAELQVASLEQQYLKEVLRSQIATLAPSWLSVLSEFAKLRFEGDISMALGTPSMNDPPELIYSAFNRETYLKVRYPSCVTRCARERARADFF